MFNYKYTFINHKKVNSILAAIKEPSLIKYDMTNISFFPLTLILYIHAHMRARARIHTQWTIFIKLLSDLTILDIRDRSEFCLAQNHNMIDNHKDATWDCTNTEAYARTCLVLEIADCLYLLVIFLLFKSVFTFWEILNIKSMLSQQANEISNYSLIKFLTTRKCDEISEYMTF